MFSWLYIMSNDSRYRRFPIPPFFASPENGCIGGSTVLEDTFSNQELTLIIISVDSASVTIDRMRYDGSDAKVRHVLIFHCSTSLQHH